jgi:hypothetical protein
MPDVEADEPEAEPETEDAAVVYGDDGIDDCDGDATG